ncbi:NifU-like protein [Mycobacterium xenopi RIVM700367]|uniref:NifU family protein n=1 Tax=Mycobacterium xenopi TaxID=1789 RepID=UPI00025ACDB4|nr:NifU family protein [Mycobacterium xenopi]EID14868.1 NifU-like protein [Mycobacterium xenopi RIVM700367]
MIPIHAIATSNPRQLCWVVPPGSLAAEGSVRHAPGRLGALLDRGVIDELVVRDSNVFVTLGPGSSWRELGDDIRDALSEALREPAGWQVDASSGELAEVTAELLAGPIGVLAESHGGSIELVSVSGDHVTVRMSGACAGCPASSSTIYGKLQSELRRRVGEQVTVSSDNESPSLSFGKKLLSLLIH